MLKEEIWINQILKVCSIRTRNLAMLNFLLVYFLSLYLRVPLVSIADRSDRCELCCCLPDKYAFWINTCNILSTLSEVTKTFCDIIATLFGSIMIKLHFGYLNHVSRYKIRNFLRKESLLTYSLHALPCQCLNIFNCFEQNTT